LTPDEGTQARAAEQASAAKASAESGKSEAGSSSGVPSGGISVTDVQVLRLDKRNEPVSGLGVDEAFAIELRFEIGDVRDDSRPKVSAQYEVQVYADPITPGPAALIAEHRGVLSSDETVHSVKLRASGLPGGIYRLVTSVAVHNSLSLSGYQDGPVLTIA
jgi:hypothetical protein